jgi:Flp pilus assembly protein TadG
MTCATAFLRRLSRSTEGAMAIETVIVAPILLVLSLGGVEAGSMVARQSELQSAAAEALNIVQAAPPINPAQRTAIRDILKASTGITSNNNVKVEEIYRCGATATFDDDGDQVADCGGADYSTYIKITLIDTYEPSWVAFGVGSEVDYNVIRTVQIS